jgi:hypothetical protein
MRWNNDDSRRGALMRAVIGSITSAVLVLTAIGAGAAPASAATFTLTATRANSGVAVADAAGTCTTQGTTTTAHCAGYDVSLAATDQILRTGDNADVRFDFSFDGADTGVVLRSTLPTGNGGALATWTAIPAACASGSTLTDGDRTLNCRIANPVGPGDGSVTARLLLSAYAFDGMTFTVPAQISSASTAAVSANSTATFTSSSAPIYNLRKNLTPNTLPGPFFYRSPSGEPGFAIPSATGAQVAKPGGYSPLAAPVTWTESLSSAAIDVSQFRLLNWGNYGDGCASQSQAATPANPGYTSSAVAISNQLAPQVIGSFDCSQPGGPGTPVQVQWQNPPVQTGGIHSHMWILFWVPASAVPIGTTPAPTATATGFDPVDVNGVSNYLEGSQPTADDARSHSSIINADNRSIAKRPVADGNTYSSVLPAGIGTTTRGASFQSVLTFQNTGTVSQTPVAMCDIFDVTTARLSPFTQGPGIPAETYVVLLSQGPTGDPILAPPFRPAAGYNNTNNFAVDPGAYVVEYAAGELGGTTPTEAPQTAATLQGAGCGDAEPATGWHADPRAQEIVDYAATLGLGDPFDVINRVRVRLTGGAVEPGMVVTMKAHFTARSTYRAATTQAGQTIYATTRLGDIGAHAYPQSTVDPWTKSLYTGPVIAGRINVNVGINQGGATTANPTTVQAGAEGLNRTTYTISPHVAFGENVATTQPLRVIDYLPRGMNYIAGSASIAPDHVLPQADGATVLVWDLGNISGATNGVTNVPSFTFQAEADPLAPTPSTNNNIIVAESVSPTGQQIDTDPPGCLGTNGDNRYLHVSIPPTPNVQVATVTDVPPPGNYTGCNGQGQVLRFFWTAVTIGNAFLDLAARKSALSLQIESGADDGVAGAQVGWNLTYANKTSNTYPGVDIVDVLPYNGDGRSPASDFSGTVRLSSLTTGDALSTTPNALPVSATIQGPRAGTTFYVTNRAPAQIERDPYAASNLQGGATRWCLTSELGSAGCPATLGDATAIRAISGELAAQAERSIRFGLATDGALDGDVINNTANARAITLTSPVVITGDAITFAASTISGTLWVDTDADGVIGAAESGRLGGVTLTISGTASTGQSVSRSTETAADGAYTFDGLPAGTYSIAVDQADARAINGAYALTADPDGTAAPDGSASIVLPLDTTITGRNFGFATSSLAGIVFGDANNDGAVDAGEEGTSGVTVTLTGTDDLGVGVNRSAVTDPDGAFSFGDVRPGTYQLVKTQPAGTLAGRNEPGTAGGTGGPVGSNTISDIVLDAGENGVNYRFGELEPRLISGTVFVDGDDDGVQDAGESGIQGVTIHLTGVTAVGDVSLTTTTLADGTFTFSGLRPGDYELQEVQPAAYLDGSASTNGALGSVSGDTISDIAVANGANTEGYTFAELPPASIAGRVFHDIDADGVQDAGEPGIEGAEVSLSGTTDTTSAITDSNGDYLFASLRPGSYDVTAGEAAGYVDGLESAGSAGGVVDNTSASSRSISDIALGVGQAATGYLFGDVRPASISGAVYVDADDDGAQDVTEAGIPGVAVTLTGTDMFGAAVSAETTTIAAGAYSIADLLPGTYTVTETQPAGYFDGKDTAGSVEGTVGADSVSGIVLTSGATATGYLFGERQPVAISGAVFSDLDGDGTRASGEAGISGVLVTLRDPDGDAITTDTTDASGAWSFAGQPPGTYHVTEEAQPLSGFIDGATVIGTGGGTAAPNAVTGIVANTNVDGYLFAEIPLSVIRGFVWHDVNDDGVRDTDEAPIEGVGITLSGAEERTTTTGPDGSYVFGGLEAGTYAISEADLPNWSDGATVVGTAGGTAATNTVTGIVLAPGQDASGYAFGERAAELQITVSTQTADAQSEPGPFVPVGGELRWTYRVINNGDTELDSVVVTDSELGDVTCATATIAPHSETTCEATGTAEAGQYRNTGTVTARVVPRDNGGSGIAAVAELTASDVSHYFGAVLAAEVTAEVDGEDAATAPGPVLPSGTEVTVNVTIENTGNVPLVLDSIDTGGLGALDCGTDATIPAGERVVCTVTWTPSAGNYVFPVSALLSGPDGTDVDGAAVALEATAGTTVFFQVLEDGVTPPSGGMATTGGTVDGRLLAATAALLLLGAALVVGGRRRRTAIAD